MRPPQQGQMFGSSSSQPRSAPSLVRARRDRVGYAEEPAGQCDIVGAIGVGEEAVVADAMEPAG